MSLFLISPVFASSAINVHITPEYVTATGYNSASGGYYWTTGTFVNYDPFSKKYGVLVWNPKGTAEGEWTSTASDADFSINGHCKGTRSYERGVWLTKVKKSSPSRDTNTSSTVTDTNVGYGSKYDILVTKLSDDWSLFGGDPIKPTI